MSDQAHGRKGSRLTFPSITDTYVYSPSYQHQPGGKFSVRCEEKEGLSVIHFQVGRENKGYH